MKLARQIELLAPAKNLECGIEAINHGADAVYIGAPAFSARAAAGNPIDDIRKLTDYAHLYRARVYVALNTILKDSELKTAEKLIHDIYRAGADALIIQDMGILNLDLPPLPLHASTQCDNRTIEKVQFLEKAGFSQVVLARELSLGEINDIADHTQVPLEVFVHGALCVSYSGQCYISQALSGRSANRGECAQYCRMSYTLQDAAGKTLVADKHLLSLKDLNQSEHLEKLLDAGVSSLKIEGRLKDVSYVKNITAYYRKKLDEIFLKRPEYRPASSGTSLHYFLPDPNKSFNRGFTSYFLSGRNASLASPDTPKSMGEPVGNVKDLSSRFFTYSGSKQVNNGDGLCFLNERKELQGFRVNRVEGNKIYPADMPRLTPGVTLFRNYDHEFEKLLSGKSAERKMKVDFVLSDNNVGFTLDVVDEDGCQACVTARFSREISRKEMVEDNIRTQLSKLGNTPFELDRLEIRLSDNWFIPSSVLSDLKRRVVETLMLVRSITRLRSRIRIKPTFHPYPQESLNYLGNVFNEQARLFYTQHGVSTVSPAYEQYSPSSVPLMFSRYCLRYQLGYCPRFNRGKELPKEPLYLLTGGKRLELSFDCRVCEMRVIT